MRKKFIAGNWKMNKTPKETTVLVNEIKELVNNPNCDILVCTPYTNLSNAIDASKNSEIKVGAQNMHFMDNGAYTAEISADMLKEMGIEYVIIGHSERREYFNETDETVNKKVVKAFEKNMIPILCVGETLTQREQGITEDIIRKQTKIACLSLTKEQVNTLIIAYEPVWAIGTGKTATNEQANEVCKLIRDCIGELYDNETKENVKVLYGGSMNAANAKGLLEQSDIDGGLIGGASLKAQDFATIIKSC